MKEKAHEMVVQVTRNVLLGERWVSPAVSAQLLQRMVMSAPRRHGDAGRANPLTMRELQVLEKIGRGRTTKEIAYALNLSPRTVDLHRASIKRKLGFRSGAEVVAYAVARL
jgi:DNA-binding NarL/FixJ family response regulator